MSWTNFFISLIFINKRNVLQLRYKKRIRHAGIQTLLAISLRVILVELLLPAFSNQFDIPVSFSQGTDVPQVLLQLSGILLIVTLLAGLYPAFVLANYNPTKVLKGNYEHGLKGVAMRNRLVVLQFQYNYVTHKDLGYNCNQKDIGRIQFPDHKHA